MHEPEPLREVQEASVEEDGQSSSTAGSSRWNFLIYFILIFLLGVIGILTYGIYSQGNRAQAPAPNPTSIALTVSQEKIYLATMTEYLCPCGACELVFIDCHCPTAQQVQLAVRQHLKDGATEEEIVHLLEGTFKAERAGS